MPKNYLAPLLCLVALPGPAALAAEDTACLDKLRPAARQAGLSGAAFERYTRGVTPDYSVLPLLDKQPEFSTPIWDYLAGLVDDERIADGQTRLREHADVLRRIGQRFGVDPAVVVAVWGVESDYGRITGKRPLRESLLALSCQGRRQGYFRGELFSFLKLLDTGDIRNADTAGSWAGAFGQTQFMPSTYLRIAVDGDGDGRRDLVDSSADALASTANFLHRSGWRAGQPWGYEVRVPAGLASGLQGADKRRPLRQWQGLGVQRADGRPFDVDPGTSAALLRPAGARGPAFLVLPNYRAIYSYNAAQSYALAIALLSDRIKGGPGLHSAWPTDDPGLDRAQRRALQNLLLARGHDIGNADGIIGDATRKAIQAEQRRLGWSNPDGRAGQKIYRALQAAQGR